MNSALRHIGSRVLHGAGYYSLRRRIDARRGKRLLVLMYHDVIDDDARATTLDGDSPTTSEFAAHIDVATRNFRVVALSDAVREVRNGGLREDSVAITFDDGHESLYRNALPVLRRFSAPATLFVLTGWVDGMTFWWHRLRGIVARASLDNVDPDRIGLVVGTPLAGLDGVPGQEPHFRRSLARVTEDCLRDMEDTAREAAIDRLRHLLLGNAEDTPLTEPVLSWNQIEEMVTHRVEMGAHTVSHVNFRYAPAATVAEEIIRSRDEIARHTDAPVVGFAFPYGKDLDHYRHYEDLLRTSGFEYACTAVPGNNRPEFDPYSLRRVTPPSTHAVGLIDHAFCQAFIRDNSFYDMRPASDR